LRAITLTLGGLAHPALLIDPALELLVFGRCALLGAVSPLGGVLSGLLRLFGSAFGRGRLAVGDLGILTRPLGCLLGRLAGSVTLSSLLARQVALALSHPKPSDRLLAVGRCLLCARYRLRGLRSGLARRRLGRVRALQGVLRSPLELPARTPQHDPYPDRARAPLG
jgi:hypothetical protein